MADDRLQKAAEAEKKLRRQLKALRELRGKAGKRSGSYDSHKERTAARQAELSESGRDIGELPAVVDPARKAAARDSFRVFCETYLPATFILDWSPDHLTAIAKIEGAVLRGELFAFAMPRGSGKTSLVEAASMWALFYGHSSFVAIVGADEEHAKGMLGSIKVECESNELILEDFPEVAFPIVSLERINNRARGQLYQGKPTNIEWKAEEIQLPAIPGSPASSGAIKVAGITGKIRGMSIKRASDRKKARPSLVLIDDPQTAESANSPSQVTSRERIIAGDILGLAGPGKRIAGLCTVTVIRTDDLADRLLDRQKHPSWQGERTKLVYEWPDAEDDWSQYAELRREGQRDGTGTGAADEFYRHRQATMDAGSRVAWPERKAPDELSAIQHAWNLRIDRGEAAFNAEFQNSPLADDITTDKLDKRQLVLRATNIARGIVPAGHTKLTAFVDVQDRLLYWLVASWSESFGGHVVAYGAHPDQGASFFEAGSARKTLALASPGAGFEAALRAGLDETARLLLARDWPREDGVPMRISQLMVDSNWGQSTAVVRNFARSSPFAAQILPSRGKGIGAAGTPMGPRKNRGDRAGLNWLVGKTAEGTQIEATYDTNFWKTFTSGRLRLGLGDPEAIMLHAGNHEMLIEHLVAEFPVRVEARGRSVDEWKEVARENHWWDCLVGCAVAASITGLEPAASEGGFRKRKKVSIPTGPDGKRVIVTKRAK
jgi:hypothetical protein